MINVLGDSVGAGLVYELSKKELEQMNINANGDVERPSNEIAMDAVESSKMWEKAISNSQIDINYTSSAKPPTLKLQGLATSSPDRDTQQGWMELTSSQHETLL